MDKARNKISKEMLAALIERDLSLQQIAAEMGVTPATARSWVRRHGLFTARSVRLKATSHAEPSDMTVDATCEHHGRTRFFRRPDGGGFRCGRCRSEAVTKRRRRVKELLVAEAGGQCRLCGYDRAIAALQFHHLDPAQKRFNLGQSGITRSLAASREEARKCVLLCANCHAEVEAGVSQIENLQPH